MSEARVDIQVDTRFQQAFAAASLDRLLLAVAETALSRELVSGPDRVTLIITDDEALRKLNREFMGYDEPTDVLSFNTALNTTPNEDVLNAHSGDGESGLDNPERGDSGGWPDVEGEESDELGDVAISYERAIAQAGAAGHDVAHELSVLTAHGVLHLLGYDHAEPEEHRMMFGKTDDILAAALDRSEFSGAFSDTSEGPDE